MTDSYSVGPPSDPAMWGPLEEPLAIHWDCGFCGETLDLDLRACADAPTCVEVVEASCGSCNRRWRTTAAPEQVAEARQALLTRILEAGHAASRSVARIDTLIDYWLALGLGAEHLDGSLLGRPIGPGPSSDRFMRERLQQRRPWTADFIQEGGLDEALDWWRSTRPGHPATFDFLNPDPDPPTRTRPLRGGIAD